MKTVILQYHAEFDWSKNTHSTLKTTQYANIVNNVMQKTIRTK